MFPPVKKDLTVEEKIKEYGIKPISYQKQPRAKKVLNVRLFKSSIEIKNLEEKQRIANLKNEAIKNGECQSPGMQYTFSQLRKMNSLKKKDYVDKILQFDSQVHGYLETAHSKAKEVATNLYELEMDIEDMQDDWDDQMAEINDKLYEKAVEVGISKEEYLHKYKFNIFDIQDMSFEKSNQGLSHNHVAGKECAHCKKMKKLRPSTSAQNLKQPSQIQQDQRRSRRENGASLQADRRKYGKPSIRLTTAEGHRLNFQGLPQSSTDLEHARYDKYKSKQFIPEYIEESKNQNKNQPEGSHLRPKSDIGYRKATQAKGFTQDQILAQRQSVARLYSANQTSRKKLKAKTTGDYHHSPRNVKYKLGKPGAQTQSNASPPVTQRNQAIIPIKHKIQLKKLDILPLPQAKIIDSPSKFVSQDTLKPRPQHRRRTSRRMSSRKLPRHIASKKTHNQKHEKVTQSQTVVHHMLHM